MSKTKDVLISDNFFQKSTLKFNFRIKHFQKFTLKFNFRIKPCILKTNLHFDEYNDATRVA